MRSSRGTFQTQGWNPHLLRCRSILYWRATGEALQEVREFFK